MMNFFSKHFIYPRRALITTVVLTVLVLISAAVLIVSDIEEPKTESQLALERIQACRNTENIAITYTLRNFHEFSNLENSGTVIKNDEYNYIIYTVKSMQIHDDPWDRLDTYGGGGVYITFTLTYPDGSTLLFESNLQSSRYTLTTPDGTVFKESCTFDASELLQFVVAHDARD